MSGMMAMAHLSDFSLTTGEVMMMGEAACEIGKYKMTVNPEGAPQMADEGKYVVVWHPQTDGSWKLHVDIWNTDIPIAAPETTMK